MLEPLPRSQWNERTAAHLLNRAGFGGTPEEVARVAALRPEAAVEQLVMVERIADDTAPPDWAKPDPDLENRRRRIRQMSPEERQQAQRQERREHRRQMVELRAWWLDRMAHGPRPLQEKMTLFWHGHFATSIQKVRLPYLMWLQNETFRRHALGSWKQMLLAVSKDPAMLIWLDGARSDKKQPNENYAREVMELFTLGEGHYTEEDIREGARAFTGWTLGVDRQSFREAAFKHDKDEKTFLGQKGKWDGEDIIRIILAQPQSERFITAKLWEFFAGEPPTQRLNDWLAAAFRRGAGDFAPFMDTVLRSREFYAPSVMRNQVKSPVQWLVGTVRLLERTSPPPVLSWNILADLGQNLFEPPNVKGWDGGIAWITTANLLARYNHAAQLVEGHQTGKRLDRDKLMEMSQRDRMVERALNQKFATMDPAPVEEIFSAQETFTTPALMEAMEKRFLSGAKLKPDRAATLKQYLDSQEKINPATVRHAIRLLMSTPDYQVT